MKLVSLSLVVISLAACGSSPTSPTSPTVPMPPVLPPAPTTITVTGHVTATNGGNALSGIQAVLGAVSTTTDSGGSFQAQLQPTSTVLLALTGAGIVPRSVTMAAGNSRDVAVNAIAMGGSFDLNFYRQLVRNAHEGGMEPLRRWTRNPNVYIQTTGIDAGTVAMVEAVIRDTVPVWTNGYQVAAVERGPDTREGQSGWVTVKWNAISDACGQAQVGTDGGWITLQTFSICGCNGWKTSPTLVRHELGHAMGFWHTDAMSDVMNPAAVTCDKPVSARERAHAAIAYQRPVGNQDPDTDSSGPVYLAPLRMVQ